MKRIFCIALVALTFCSAASAQHNLRTGYFLDGYVYKHKLNPAFASDRGYFAFPVLGYTTLGVETNLSLSSILYPTGNGTLTTFMSKSVSVEDLMSRISNNNPLNINADISLVSLGFHAGESFNTIDLSIKAEARTSIPGSLFSWVKQYNEHFDMSDMGLDAGARLELSYGYSRSIADFMRVGAKVKLIAGLAKARYTMDRFTLDLQEDKWRAEAQGNGYLALPGARLNSENGVIRNIDMPADFSTFIDAAIDSKNLGAAVDLGISMDLAKILTVSASVTDLGFINWNGNKLGSNNRVIEYTGNDNIGAEGVDIGDQLSLFGEELVEILSPKALSEERLMDMLSMTAHVGVECRMPFWERLSVGALGSYRFDGPYSWWEARGSVNLALFRWLSFSGNHAWSTYGDSYGAAMNFHPNGINLFVGVDSFKPAMNVTPQFIPIDEINTNLAIGLNIVFGKYHGRYPRKVRK